MAQVAGRSGRKHSRGVVLIQTWQPAHPIIRQVVANDYTTMYVSQLQERSRFRYQPFYRLIVVRIKHKSQDHLNEAASILARELRAEFGKRILGPEFPMVSRIMNLYIKQIMIKFERGNSLITMKDRLRPILEKFSGKKEFSGVRLIVDVDPM